MLWALLPGIPKKQHYAHGLKFSFENYFLLEYEIAALIKIAIKQRTNIIIMGLVITFHT